MKTQFKFKILTSIVNSKANKDQKRILESYIKTLDNRDLARLLVIFEKDPRTIPIYADYLKKLKEQTQPVSPEKLEEIITPLLDRLS